MIPLTYDQWRNCIVHDCGISLTKDFAEQRLSVYHNSDSQETKKFVQLYGEQHLQNVINWLSITIKQ